MILFIIIFVISIALCVYYASQRPDPVEGEQSHVESQPRHFDLLDENGDPIGAPKVKIVMDGGDSNAPVQELQYFCIKDKGYHVTVWPKDYDQFDVVEFSVAGLQYRTDIDNYLGEFEGTLEPEPDNDFDPNAIKILAADGHHVGYVPRDFTDEVRDNAKLPCPCFCYIGNNEGTYFSDCYILRKNI